MATVTLKAIQSKEHERLTLIKHNRKIYAKIWRKEQSDQFIVEMNGFSWPQDNSDNAREFVISQTESFLEAIGAPARVQIIAG